MAVPSCSLQVSANVWEVAEFARIENVPARISFQEPIYENDHILTAVSFTPNGELIAVDHAGVVRIWETTSWKLVDTLQFPRATAMDVSPDGSLLALGFGVYQSEDTGVILWDLDTKKHRRTLVGHRPFAVAFSPDGKTLASTSGRHDVVLWDVATGLPLRTMEGHTNTIAGAAFSNDGTKLATTDFSGNLRIREAATLAEIDRHPVTLRSIFRLGVMQNRERRYVAAEKTLQRLLNIQSRMLSENDPKIAKTLAEIAVASDGRRKMTEPLPPRDSEP